MRHHHSALSCHCVHTTSSFAQGAPTLDGHIVVPMSTQPQVTLRVHPRWMDTLSCQGLRGTSLLCGQASVLLLVHPTVLQKSTWMLHGWFSQGFLGAPDVEEGLPEQGLLIS
jgi:hypothetical protein